MENLQLNGQNYCRRSRSTRHAFTALFTVALLLASATSSVASGRRARLSSDLAAQMNSASSGPFDLIFSGPPERTDRLVKRHGLTIKKVLSSGAVVRASRAALTALSNDPEVEALSGDGVVRSQMAVSTATTGAEAAWAGTVASLGSVNGRGIGVAILDSGIADHPALRDRVVASMNFTDSEDDGRDEYGHGTHIAGIIAARSFKNSAEGAESGMAPAAHLINLKVLGADGSGRVSNVIEAIDWAIRYRKALGIRVLNLSLGAVPTQSYKDDPLGQAVKRAVEAGLVVVASAGNYGINDKGQLVYGCITSPGNSPYVITVGAIRTQGTADKGDDEVAPWSCKGPTLFDHIVKPDLVAPGSKIVSTAATGATLMTQFPDRLVDGPGARDYFSMSGTSMSSAFVAGAVALLLDGRGDLTPLEVKMTLQASADFMPSAGVLAGGAGSLNLEGIGPFVASVKGLRLTEERGYAYPPSAQHLLKSETIIWGDKAQGDTIIWGD